MTEIRGKVAPMGSAGPAEGVGLVPERDPQRRRRVKRALTPERKLLCILASNRSPRAALSACRADLEAAAQFHDDPLAVAVDRVRFELLAARWERKIGHDPTAALIAGRAAARQALQINPRHAEVTALLSRLDIIDGGSAADADARNEIENARQKLAALLDEHPELTNRLASYL